MVAMAYQGDETPWQRLHRVAEERRRRLGFSQAGIKARGGPSPSAVQAFRHHAGSAVTVREGATLRAMDGALGWPTGSSAQLVTETRPDMLDDLEDRLLDAQDQIAAFAWMVEQRLRLLGDDARETAFAEVARILGLRVTE